MALNRDKLSIEVFGPSAKPEAAPCDVSRADEVVLVLAHLIGCQIAREHFERRITRERKGRKPKNDGGLP
jgi:hypothetical protein